MIKIHNTPYADTRTCNKIPTKQDLLEDSLIHIKDVKKIMKYIGEEFFNNSNHDYTKIEFIDDFYNDFISTMINGSDFTAGKWYQNHIRKEKHHPESFVALDITLMDIIEYIVDNVCSGKARSGQIREMHLDSKILEKAFQNTVKYLDNITEV